MTHSEFVILARLRAAKARAIARTIEQERVASCLVKCSDEQRRELDRIINEADWKGLQRWIYKQSEDLERLTIRQLRVLGARYGVPYYSQIPKDALIRQINKRRHVEEKEVPRTEGDSTDSQRTPIRCE